MRRFTLIAAMLVLMPGPVLAQDNQPAVTPMVNAATASLSDVQPCTQLATTVFKRATYIPNAVTTLGALPLDKVLVTLFVLQSYEFGEYHAMSQPDSRYIRVISDDDVICWFKETVISVGSG
jgi:hypothetical protein